MRDIKGQTAKSVHRSAPVGGLNAKNSLAQMEPTDAIILENFFPTSGGCKVRGGCKKWSSISGVVTVNTLMVWNSPTSDNPTLANQKLIAAAGTGMYDVTAENAVPTTLLTGLTNDQWQSINFVNSAGTFLYAVNGADQPVVYTTGAVITRPQNGAGATQITGSGLSSVNNFINICVHQKRIWFVEKNSTKAWYLATNALYGTATLFDFGYLFSKGGHLKALATWTIDSGSGPDDYLVAISSKGEAVVYSGTDPSTAATWKLIGVFYIGSPSGYRCAVKYGGDLAIVTQFGVVPLSDALKSTQEKGSTLAFTDKIQLAISDLISKNFYTFGWQPFILPKFNMLMINVPFPDGEYRQYVMNTTLGSWCLFRGFNSSCLVEYYEDLYFAIGNVVYKGLYGNLDGVELDGSGGNPILALSQTAFDFMEDPTSIKASKFVKPVLFLTAAAISYGAKTLSEYNISLFTDILLDTPGASASYWDFSVWDTALWSESLVTRNSFTGATSLGYGLATVLKVSSATDTNWVATTTIYETGGLIG